MRALRHPAILSSFALVTAAACSVPSRDNVYDPARDPVAKIVARICPEPAPGSAVTRIGPRSVATCPEGLEGTRRTRFTFDASDSVDPYGRGKLRFDWDVDGSGAFALSTGTSPLVETTVGLPASSLPASGIGSAQRPVSVRVRSADGHTAQAQVQVIVKNSAPTVDPGEDLFVPEHTGADVLLDVCGGMPEAACTSSDPDGDPLVWTWERLDGPIPASAVLENGGARLRFAASSTAGTMLFRLSGTDGLATSTRVTRVVVGTQFWAATSNPTQLFRVFPEFAAAVDSTGGLITPSIDPVTGEVWTATYGRVVRVFSADLDEPRASLTYNPVLFQSIAATGSGACAAYKDGNVNFASFIRLDENAQVTAGPTLAPISVNDDAEVHPSPIPGTCWAVTSSALYLFAPDGTLTPVVLTEPLGGVFAAVPDQAGFLWVADSGGIHRIDVAGGETTFDVSADFAAFSVDPSGDGVWYADRTKRSLFHLHQIGSIEPLAGVDIAAEAIAADPADHSLWAVDLEQNAIVHLGLVAGHYVEDAERTFAESGFPGLTPSPFEWRSVTVDPIRHRLIAGVTSPSTSSGGLLAIPETLARVAAVPALVGGGTLGASVESTRGTLWSLALGYAPYVERIAFSGRRLSRTDLGSAVSSIVALRDGSAWVADMPYPSQGSLFKLSATGALVATYSLGGGHAAAYIDGDETHLCATLDPVGATNARAAEITFSGGALQLLIHPGLGSFPNYPSVYYPVAAPDGTCWHVTNDGNPSILAVHYASGATDPDVSAPLARLATAYAADPLDSSLWLATDTTGTISVVHVTRGGVVTSTQLALPGVTGMHVLARCNDSANPDCREIWYLTATSVAKAVGSAPATIRDTYLLPNTSASSSFGELVAAP